MNPALAFLIVFGVLLIFSNVVTWRRSRRAIAEMRKAEALARLGRRVGL